MQSGSVVVKIGLVAPLGNPLEASMRASGLRVTPYDTLAEAQAAFYQRSKSRSRFCRELLRRNEKIVGKVDGGFHAGSQIP